MAFVLVEPMFGAALTLCSLCSFIFVPRLRSGQRHSQWDALIFVDPRRYSRQQPYYDDGDRRDDNILLAQAGSLNVRGPVSINFIGKIVVNARDIPFPIP